MRRDHRRTQLVKAVFRLDSVFPLLRFRPFPRKSAQPRVVSSITPRKTLPADCGHVEAVTRLDETGLQGGESMPFPGRFNGAA
jgi:hypothetical protein